MCSAVFLDDAAFMIESIWTSPEVIKLSDTKAMNIYRVGKKSPYTDQYDTIV